MNNSVFVCCDITPPSISFAEVNAIGNGETENTVEIITICDDADTTGYQMKIWGIDGVPEESDAVWEAYSPNRIAVPLLSDGRQSVKLKIRDTFLNETDEIFIIYEVFFTIPVADVFSDCSGLSLDEGRTSAIGKIRIDKDIDALKIVIAETCDAAFDDSENITVRATAGSFISNSDSFISKLSGNKLEFYGKQINAGSELTFLISYSDFKATAGENELKIVKVFVRNAKNGKWSL